MASQDRISTGGSSSESAEELPEPAPAAPAAQESAQTQGVDDLLDEIDGVLESNAEEFVRGFVQKGGQ
ncbi:ubiquitin-like protein Pup [Arthrobacter agilis]|uniref:ubiquitin-like protein Pup n=1 Tax=Arthrobacter agilis TaxID=37921 RepID=UPI000B34D6E1|nr:ubiquitin-like protein Pup [Arthrobacter agilis]PPB47443.1 ubiquitin-like protein Pup [Arthrobacter agilis]TPV22830.1 ubiquitin-like protein Pup [Arthrobacter agilis]VDR32082.1 Bacterial ubiquitin-like modifier [Arthrobacter agilis]